MTTSNKTFKSLYPSLEEFIIQEEISIKNDLQQKEENDLTLSVYSEQNQELVLTNNDLYFNTKKNDGITSIQFRKNQGLVMTFQSHKMGIFISNLNQIAIDIGLHIGDQIINMNGMTLSGLKKDKVLEFYNRYDPAQLITIMVRDRPYAKVITLTKSPANQSLGFKIKNGYVTDLIKDSSAHRNGLLIDHKIAEINGYPVFHLNDREIIQRVHDSEFLSVHLTTYPKEFFERLVKKSWW